MRLPYLTSLLVVVSILPVIIAEPDVFGDYFDDGMKLVDISQDSALRSCLSDGKTADKTKAAYDECYGQGYDFDDLAKAGGDDDGLPDELEEKEGCFYKKMGWVSEDNVMDEAAIAADMEGLEKDIQEGFLSDVGTCVAWSGNFGERRKREAGMEVLGEAKEREVVPGLMDTGRRALGWVRKLVRKVRSPGNRKPKGKKNCKKNGNGKCRKRSGGNGRKGKKGKLDKEKKVKKPKKRKGTGRSNKRVNRRNNNNSGNRNSGGRRRSRKPNNKRPGRGGQRRARKRQGKGDSNKKGKNKPGKENKNPAKKRNNGSRKDQKKEQRKSRSKGKKGGKNNKQKNEDSNERGKQGRQRKNDKSLPEAVYNKLWCIDLAIEQALEKCVEEKIQS